VRFEITAPFTSSGYCHCLHCQRRTGTAASANARIPTAAFRLLSGQDELRSFTPAAGGMPKVFCSVCGSALYSGDPQRDDVLGVRLGALDEDPGIRPQHRQFVDRAVPWEPIPDDGLPRYGGSRSA